MRRQTPTTRPEKNQPSQASRRPAWDHRLLAASFVVGQALLVAASGGGWLTPLLASLSALVTAILGWQFRFSWRLLICLVAVLAGAVSLKSAMYPYPEELSSWVLPAAWTLGLAELLLLVQALWLWHRPDTRSPLEFVASLGLVTVVCVFNRTVDRDLQQACMLAAILFSLQAVWLLQLAARPRIDESSPSRPRAPRQQPEHWGGNWLASWLPPSRLLRWLLIGAAAVGGWQVSELMTRNVDGLRPWSYDFGLASRRTSLAGDYVRDATLHSIAASKTEQPNQVALRVVSAHSPGYLRGRVFDSYVNAHWYSRPRPRTGDESAGDERRSVSVLTSPPAGIAQPRDGQRLFGVIQNNQGPWRSYTILNDPRRGQVYFTPLGTSYLQAAGRSLTVDQHRVVVSGISTRKPYTAFVGRGRMPVELTREERAYLLTTPTGLDPRVAELADAVCRGRRTTRGKVEAVETFFSRQFRYGMGTVRPPGNTDPLSYFLLERPAAHCEFFASGAIALLRSQGVPCRYVTGYVVDEQDEYGDYWLARNRNAHAWVEAYDDQQRQWMLVEATPGMTAPSDSLLAEVDQANAGGLSQAAAFGLDAGMFQGGWSLQSLPALVALLIGLSVAGAYVYWRPEVLARLRSSPTDEESRLSSMRRQLKRMDRRLRRQRLVRRGDETLHQFSRRIRSAAADDPQLAQAAQWYLHYARIRYQASDLGESLPLLPARSGGPRARYLPDSLNGDAE